MLLSSFASITAGTATDVTLTIAGPTEGAQSQGGVVQVRSGKRANPCGSFAQARLRAVASLAPTPLAERYDRRHHSCIY